MMDKTTTMRMIAGFFLVCLLIGCGGSNSGSTASDNSDGSTIDPTLINPSSIETFETGSGDICREDDKPVIRLFSTTWCPHCVWIADTYDAVVKMYVEEGAIVAHHWEVDTGDDTLTLQDEGGVPGSEMAIFNDFNSQESIPTFVFGCKYYRIGNGHEQEDDLEAEAAEFMAVIEALLNEP